jgi:hypothetical protein
MTPPKSNFRSDLALSSYVTSKSFISLHSSQYSSIKRTNAQFILGHSGLTLSRIITIHQAALMINPEIYQAKISQYCSGNSSQSRPRASETILLSSARQIGSLQIGLNDQSIRSCLFTVTQVMLAAMVLAFNIMKHPTRVRNRPDAEVWFLSPYNLET